MSETLWGVLIGAVLAILGGAIAQTIGNYFECKREKLAKKREAYETIHKAIYCFQMKNYVKDDEVIKLLEETNIKALLYLGSEPYKLFRRYALLWTDFEHRTENEEELTSLRNKLFDMMRADLGTK